VGDVGRADPEARHWARCLGRFGTGTASYSCMLAATSEPAGAPRGVRDLAERGVRGVPTPALSEPTRMVLTGDGLTRSSLRPTRCADGDASLGRAASAS